ncbi:MAG: cupin domain-containing protein [Nevskiaceae bacterium]|nr:MAG: cupin domain-containing protein [Nevskiaceae bacterium]TBR74635.1 MAG: cupin domain-containing protein [Nevskiaceae bacterium]
MQAARSFASIVAGAALLCAAALPVHAADAGATIIPRFNQPITNIPGKSLVAVEVDYAPGASTPAHHHDKSAFIMGYVLSGAIKSQVDDGPVKVYHAGETFHEVPGASHRVSANASRTQPAKLLAVFVVDTHHGELTTLDAH